MNKENTFARRRVVITGMGLISSLGMTIEDFWESIVSGRSGCVRFPLADSLPMQFAAPVTEFAEHIDQFGPLPDALRKTIRKSLKLMSREIQMGVASSQRALMDARLIPTLYSNDRVGVSFASDYIITTPDELQAGMVACSPGGQFDFSQWAEVGMSKMAPIWQLKFLPNMQTSHLSILNEFRGPCNAITNREASISAALGEATEIIRAGKADVMVVGASGSRLHPFKLIHTWQQEELTGACVEPEVAVRPFDPNRSGTIPGEGAATIILEELDSALARGATIYAEVIGATNCRVSLPVDRSKHALPLGDVKQGVTLALQKLINRYSIDLSEIGHINACGFGCPKRDAAEAQAIHAVLGEQADHICVTGLKGQLGNPGAAGGVMELIAGVLALQKNRLFPMVNNDQDDPDCPICINRDQSGPAGSSFVKIVHERFGQTGAIYIKKFNTKE